MHFLVVANELAGVSLTDLLSRGMMTAEGFALKPLAELCMIRTAFAVRKT